MNRLDAPSKVPTSIRVLIADGDPVVREAIFRAIATEARLVVVSSVAEPAAAIAAVRELVPDVAVLDPQIAGEVLGQLHDAGVRVITFATRATRQEALLGDGVAGYVLKDHGVGQIPAAIYAVAAGHAVLPLSSVLRAPESRSNVLLAQLTLAEGRVLQLLAAGLSTAEISEALIITEGTVKSHISRILAKLHARDRVQAVVIAYQAGFVLSRSVLTLQADHARNGHT